MGDKKCDGDHVRHLCSLAKKGKIKEIKTLVNEPEYICSKCGRAANDKERVCKPEKL